MNRADWLGELQALAARYGGCLGADLAAALSVAELWGVYAFLRAWTERAG